VDELGEPHLLRLIETNDMSPDGDAYAALSHMWDEVYKNAEVTLVWYVAQPRRNYKRTYLPVQRF
jgi:hypothetical protein